MINKLTEAEFQSYFTAPMRLIGEDEKSSGIHLGDYVLEILKVEDMGVSLDDIEIPYVYEGASKNYEHILLSFGIDDSFIVIVTDRKEIIGYHVLDLKELYGIKKN